MAAEPRDFDWRREIQRRLDDLEEKVSSNETKLERLVDRQQLQHEQNSRKLDQTDESLKRIGRMLIGERGDNGLVGTVKGLAGEVSNARKDVQEIRSEIKHLPKNLAIGISILIGLLTLFSFLGPSMRRLVGLPAAHATPGESIFFPAAPKKLDSAIPPTISQRR